MRGRAGYRLLQFGSRLNCNDTQPGKAEGMWNEGSGISEIDEATSEHPTLESASSEIVNLMAICGLPKGTEYFFSDLHGEYEAFYSFAPQFLRHYT